MRATTRRIRGAAALVLVALAAPAALAESPQEPPPVCAGRDISADPALRPDALERARQRRGDESLNGQGLLWRVEKPPAAPSYLFGTIHSTDDRAVAIARAAAAHVAGAKIVATELGGPFDAYGLAELGATLMVRALARDVDTLAGIGSPAEVALVEKFLAGRGVAVELAHRLRPWFLAALAAAPACEAQRQLRELPVVDELIARTAKGLGVKVVGLETVAEQADLLAALDPKLAAMALVSTARRPQTTDDFYATLVSLYVQQRPSDIFAVIDASGILTPEETAAQDAMTRSLLGARNRTMAEHIAPLLAAGGAFVAVGALHLVGRDGLIELLRGMGYAVTAEP
jgi:uncharacterized protein YbaP (TraB family)